MITYLVIHVPNRERELTMRTWLSEERKNDASRAQLGAIAGDRDINAWWQRLIDAFPNCEAHICRPNTLGENLTENDLIVTFVDDLPV